MMNLFVLAGALDLIKPDPGLIFWTTLIFLILWTILSKVAFKPIGKALKARQESINEALQAAEKAKEEMAALNAQNEALLREAREERATMLKEAKVTADNMISQAKEKASNETQRLLDDAKMEIDTQKRAAMAEVKAHVGTMAVEIAEKVLRRELAEKPQQEAFVGELLNEASLN